MQRKTPVDFIINSWDIVQIILKLVILGNFCPFTPLKNPKNQDFEKWKKLLEISYFTHVYQKSQSYDVQFLRYGVRQFFVIPDHFLPFYTSMDLENQKFEKIKKPPKEIIIFQMCTINDSQMMYGSWDMECNGQNILWFWTIFCPFNPLITQKTKILKKKKKPPRDIIILHRCNINDICMVPEIPSMTEFFVILDHFLPFYPN